MFGLSSAAPQIPQERSLDVWNDHYPACFTAVSKNHLIHEGQGENNHVAQIFEIVK